MIDVKIRGGISFLKENSCCYPKEGEMRRQAETTDESNSLHMVKGEKVNDPGKETQIIWRSSVLWGPVYSSLYVKILAVSQRASVEGQIIFLLWI